ncbi:unnamed protein product [Peniophora sp. CBMAI 1063]|nr:unnamed protein product [Peniophora sp. CBMAI 1063]
MPTLNVTVQLAGVVNDIKSMADYRIFPVILESVLLALHAVLIVLLCIKYWGDKDRVLGVFAVSACLFIMTAAEWALDIWVLALELYRLLPSRLSPDGVSIPINEALKELNGNVTFARDTCLTVVFILCDSISLWRAYVIYGRPMWLKFTCCSLVAVSCILYLLDMVVDLGKDLMTPAAMVIHNSTLGRGVAIRAIANTALAITALSQVLATVLIARKAILYRKEMKLLLSAGPYNFRMLVPILYVLVETGIVYSLLWVIFVISNSGNVDTAATYWSEYWIGQISGIYPTLIVVVVSRRASILEQSIHCAPALQSTSIHFATNIDMEELELPSGTLDVTRKHGELAINRADSDYSSYV